MIDYKCFSSVFPVLYMYDVFLLKKFHFIGFS